MEENNIRYLSCGQWMQTFLMLCHVYHYKRNKLSLTAKWLGRASEWMKCADHHPEARGLNQFIFWGAWSLCLNHTWTTITTRSTQRAQTSLAEADHYPHIVHCKNAEPWWWKTTPSPSPPPPTPPPKKKKKRRKKSFGSLPAPRSGYATTIMFFFTHLLILEYRSHHQNLISSSLYYPEPLHKISSKSVHIFLSNIVHRQTNRQTDKPTLPKT